MRHEAMRHICLINIYHEMSNAAMHLGHSWPLPWAEELSRSLPAGEVAAQNYYQWWDNELSVVTVGVTDSPRPRAKQYWHATNSQAN